MDVSHFPQATTPPNQGRPDSPVYANLQELKISQSALPPLPGSPAIQINGEWETHKDSSGRCYYYNRGTQERTWKPPRSTRDTNISKGDFQSPGDQEVTGWGGGCQPLCSPAFFLSFHSTKTKEVNGFASDP